MIQDFFKSSDSPLSNHQVSLNFTRTSRQCQSNTKKPQPQQQIQVDYLTLVQQQNQQIQQWIENVRNGPIRLEDQQGYQGMVQVGVDDRDYQGQNDVREEVWGKISILKNRIKGRELVCQKCQGFQRAMSKLEMELAFKQEQLIEKTKAIQGFNKIKLNLQQKNKKLQNEHKSFQSLSKQFHQKSLQLSKIIEQKDRQMNRLNQQLQRLQILQKSCLLQKSSSYNFKPRNSMQRSKSFLLSAAKNSTSHTQFNISKPHPQQPTYPSHNQKPTQFSQFLLILQKLKQTFLQLYKKEEKQFLGRDFQQMRVRNGEEVKGLVAGFRRGNRVYEVARGCRVLVEYIKMDKENLQGLLKTDHQQVNGNSMVNCFKHQSQKQINFIQQNQKKKQSKIQSGLQSEIKNLNSQLQSLRKNLTRQKQQKKLLKQKLQSSKKLPKSSQQVLLQQSYHHLLLSHKQLEYNFQKQHKQRMKLHCQLQKYQHQQRAIISSQSRKVQPQTKPQIKALRQSQNKQIEQQKIQNNLSNAKKPSSHRNSHSNSISPQPIDKQSLKRLRISSRSSLS